MDQHYLATFQDRFGTEQVILTNDGHILRMTLRGLPFISTMLDDWEPDGTYTDTQLQAFRFDAGHLTDYTLNFDMPVPVVVQGVTASGTLHIALLLAGSVTDRANAREELRLHLTVRDQTYKAQGAHGFFEDALIDLQHQLPAGISLQTCFFCALSDYSPYGNGLFGCLACFRGNKSGYQAVRTKSDLFAIWSSTTEYVQETYHCAEFEQRGPNTGYRG